MHPHYSLAHSLRLPKYWGSLKKSNKARWSCCSELLIASNKPTSNSFKIIIFVYLVYEFNYYSYWHWISMASCLQNVVCIATPSVYVILGYGCLMPTSDPSYS